MAAGITAAMVTGVLWAQSTALDTAVRQTMRINENARQTQARIDNLADQTQELLAHYRAVVSEIDGLRVYNTQLEKVVDDQLREVASIKQQLEGLEDTNRGIVPLMLQMIDMLGRIVENDVPFLIDARRQRVERLRGMVDRADITTSEKYRALMESYQAELEYGRTTEAYSGRLPGGGVVDFLRVGRTLLLYQSRDGTETGWWNRQTRQFERLDDDYRLPVKEGLDIARNLRVPNLVVLPVPAPEAGQ